MVCPTKSRSVRPAVKDPCDPDTIMGIPVPMLLNGAVFGSIFYSLYLIKRDHCQRFMCYVGNVISFLACFLFFHAILHSQGFYQKIFCGCFPACLVVCHLLCNFYKACKFGGNEWCKLIYNVIFMVIGFAIAIAEYFSEVTYCHCLPLDILAMVWGMTLKEYNIVEGLPEPWACALPYLCEGFFILGTGKGLMTCILKFIAEMTDACPPTPIPYMDPVD